MYTTNNSQPQPVNLQKGSTFSPFAPQPLVFYGQPIGQGSFPAPMIVPSPFPAYNHGVYAPPSASNYQIQYTLPSLAPQYGFVPFHPGMAVIPQQSQGFQNNTVKPTEPALNNSPLQIPNSWVIFNTEPVNEPKFQELAKFDDPFELKDIPKTTGTRNVTKGNQTPPKSETKPFSYQKRCKRCSRYYLGNEPSECRYHPGQYKCWYSSKILAGHINSWTCCKLDERDAKGCKVGPSHIECEATSATFSQLDRMITHGERPTTVPKVIHKQPSKSIYPTIDEDKEEFIDPTLDLRVDLKSFRVKADPDPNPPKAMAVLDPDAQVVVENGEKYIKHIIKYTDTLRGLSLKYQVEPEEIKSVNKLVRDEDIWSRYTVLVPYNGQMLKELNEDEKERYRDDMRRRLVRRFMRNVKCNNDSEALYYLQTNAFNLENAIAEYRADVEWEIQNKYVQFTSIRV